MTEPRFRFRAEVVLELRKRRDAEAQEMLKSANLALNRAEGALADAQQALALACRRPVEPGADPDWYRTWMSGLRAVIAARADERVRHLRARDEAVSHAAQVRQALRVIERLRERRLRAFELERSRREQRQIDELGTQRFHARRT